MAEAMSTETEAATAKTAHQPTVDLYWLLKLLNAALSLNLPSTSSISAAPLSGGYLGSIFRVTSQLPGGGARTFILKFGPSDPRFTANQMHEREMMFYRTPLSSAFRDRSSATASRIRVAQCFAAALPSPPTDTSALQNSGYLLLEDLAPLAPTDYVAGLSYDQVAIALRALAKLHAPYWHRQVDKRLLQLFREHKIVSEPDIAAEAEADRSDAKSPTETSASTSTSTTAASKQKESAFDFALRWYKRFLPEVAAAVDKYTKEAAEAGDKRSEYEQADKVVANAQSLLSSYDRLLKQWRALPTCLVHGDAWGNNMLFGHSFSCEGGKEKTHVDVALIDFQFLNIGSGLFDVAFLLRTSVNPSFLRDYEQDLLREYHQALIGEYSASRSAAAHVDKKHSDEENTVAFGSNSYSFDECWAQYQLALSFAAVMMIGGLPIMTSHTQTMHRLVYTLQNVKTSF